MIEKATQARPYAKAVFALAEQGQSHEKWAKNLKALSFIVMKTRDLLKARSILFYEIQPFFLETILPQISDSFFKNFLLVLAENKRLSVLPEIAVLYESMWMVSRNTIQVDFFTPTAIEKKQQEKYKKLLEKQFSKTAEMAYHVDENLLGGFWAKAGNNVINGSVPGFLTDLKVAMGG